MAAAESVIQQRLVNLNITDNEVYTDYNKDRIIVRFPWKEGETDFNPESAIQEIGATAVLTFREGKEVDSEGKPTGVTAENIILEGKDIKSATAAVDNNANSATYGQYYVRWNSTIPAKRALPRPPRAFRSPREPSLSGWTTR